MTIKRIRENPNRKYTVKHLPKDSKYIQNDINGNKIYYSKMKQGYYLVTE
jgi:myo-inositol-hexaphosphate 3-phosphohydrolase